jgi:glycerate dehydrogenase
VAGTGTDNIDLEAPKSAAIGVCNVRGYCTPSVAQHVWSMILSLTQHLPAYTPARDRRGLGRRRLVHGAPNRIRELRGRRSASSAGASSAARSRIGESFGMRVSSRTGRRRGRPKARRQRVLLRELLAVADIVSLHCPLTDANPRHDRRAELALMKKDALLINTARGALIDSGALAAALKSGRLGGAGIDVLPQEPPVDGRPAARRRDPESAGDAARRLGGARIASALPR